MSIKKQIVVSFTAEEIVNELLNKDLEEIGTFIDGLANTLNIKEEQRTKVIKLFGDALSENACRFLSEVVCQYHWRNRV